MKFSLVIVSAFVGFGLVGAKDVIGFANLKARETLAGKINSGVQAKLESTFGEENLDGRSNSKNLGYQSSQGVSSSSNSYVDSKGAALKQTSTSLSSPINPIGISQVVAVAPAAVPRPTVFPILQNTENNLSTQGQNIQVIEVKPSVVPTVTQAPFVQLTPPVVVAPEKTVFVAEPPVVVDTVVPREQVLPLVVPLIPETKVFQTPSNYGIDSQPALKNTSILEESVIQSGDNGQISQNLTIQSNVSPDNTDEDEPETNQIQSQNEPPPGINTQNQQLQSSPPAENFQPQFQPEPESKPEPQTQSHQDTIYLTPQLNLMRGLTNTIKGQQNILDGTNNKIKGHLNIAQGHQNEIYGLGNDIIANRAVVKGHQNTIIQDIGQIELF